MNAFILNFYMYYSIILYLYIYDIILKSKNIYNWKDFFFKNILIIKINVVIIEKDLLSILLLARSQSLS